MEGWRIMKKKDLALRTAGVIFLLIALLHLGRLILKFEVIVSHFLLPLWINAAGFILAGLLAWWMFKLSR